MHSFSSKNDILHTDLLGQKSPNNKQSTNGNESLLSEIFSDHKNEIPKKHVLRGKKVHDSSDDLNMKLKQKRKRRVFSCDNCRKLKTKCVIVDGCSNCQRCLRLQLSCNLPIQQPNNIFHNEKIETADSIGPHDLPVLKDSIEEKTTINSINEKIDFLIRLQEKGIGILENNFKDDYDDTLKDNNLAFNKTLRNREVSQDGSILSISESIATPSLSSFSDLSLQLPVREDMNAPLNLINNIQQTLVLNNDKINYRSEFENATNEFLEFYLENEELCLKLSKIFLEIFHYYIIPGGISAIDREYVLEHPFITCVFVLITMMVSKEYKHTSIERRVAEILKNIISNLNNKEPVSDHDIESILYICMYDIGKFDKWILSTIGIMHFFRSIDIRNIVKRIINDNNYCDDDLFHLRILNSLFGCQLQMAIGMGKLVLINENYFKLFKLTINFPNATIGDAIQVAQLDLFKMLVKILKSEKYFRKDDNFIIQTVDDEDDNNNDNQIFECKELSKWKDNWEQIINKDVTKISYYSYYFAYILISRKYIEDKSIKDKKEDPLFGFNTASYYSFKLLKMFLECKPEFIKGIPSFQLNEIVYGCITLFEYLNHMNVNKRQKTLNVISKIYWQLNKQGQEMNDLILTIAEIIKQLVELANKNEVLNINFRTIINKGFIGSGAVRKSTMFMHRKNSQQQKKLSAEDLAIIMNNPDNRHGNYDSDNRFDHNPDKVSDNVNLRLNETIDNWPSDLFELPDLSNFASFDDFYQDLFQQR
jgi:hypothetical protein